MASNVTSSDPLLRVIPFSEAGEHSPWPNRLLGTEQWQKAARSREEMLTEYNDGWYRPLLEEWRTFVAQTAPDRRTPLLSTRFFYRVAKSVAAEVEANRAVYRSSQFQYLFSIGDEFLVGDLTLGSMIHWELIVRYVDRHLAGMRTVVETGCGSGVNLFNLYAHLDVDLIVGGDVCTNAVTLSNEIATATGIPGRFGHFDYGDVSSLRALTAGLVDYVLLTCHSIEQIQIAETQFIDSVLSLPNRPSRVIHCEPALEPADGSLMGQLCRQYASRNKYNLDLLPQLLRAQMEGRLEVVDYQPRVFGISAFNPTSLICWKPQ